MKITAYNFYKEDDEVCEANTSLLHRVVGLEVVDILPEEHTDLVDKYEVCMTPTVVFLNESNEVVAKLCKKVTVADLDKIFS